MVIAPEEIFRTLGDGIRLRVLMLLRNLELTVSELAQVLGQTQPRMSQHLRQLQEAGLVQRRKEGNAVFLSVGSAECVQPLFALLDSWSAVAGPFAWFDADRARLRAIRADRALEAQRFFEKNSPRWGELRSLMVSDAEIQQAILAALDGHDVGRLLDIGTGIGRMLELLAPRATAALGIDRSPEMLRFARETLLGKVQAELRHADMYALPMEDQSFDTVILHQVLHYAHHPEAVLAEAARVLAPGGRMLIVDVAPHEHEELRRRFAHARLGFSDKQVLDWLQEVGLQASVTAHLPSELVTVIWRATRVATD